MNTVHHSSEAIAQYIARLENEHDVTVLLACETGSRAWGFPSPDSDYDVRLIYQHKTDWYVTLTEAKDTIDIMYDNNEVDLSGWELRKALRLLHKSNAPLLERIQSPIIYKQDDAFVKHINDVAELCYSKIATMHHYLSMAKKCLADIEEQPEYKLKRFFYGLRAATVCLWILEKDAIPPTHFPSMLTQLAAQIDADILKRIDELIALKATKDESYRHTGEIEVIQFIKSCIERASEQAASLPASKGGMVELNALLQQQILEHR